MLVEQYVNHGEQECGIRLRPDRYPFGRTSAGNGKVGFDLNPFESAHARIRVAPHAGNPAGRFDIASERDHVACSGRVRRDDEGTVPQFAVEMFGVIALHALSAADSEIDRAPGREKRRQGSHIALRRSAAAETGRDARITGIVDKTARADVQKSRTYFVECLVPGNRNERGVLVPAFLGVRPAHRSQDAVRIVGFLNQSVGLNADAAAAGMNILGGEIRFDLARHAILDFDRQ